MSARIVGLILAGGLARRMGGGDKPLREVAGRPLLARAVERLAPQVDDLLLNANGDPARFAAYDLPVVEDALPGALGPLAGVLAGLEWAARHRPGARALLSAPGDAPFLPRDLAPRLLAALEGGAGVAVAESGGRAHPVAALWPLALAGPLRAALEGGLRKIDRFTADHAPAHVAWDAAPVDPFFNANAPEDLAEAERLAAAHPGA